jgi:lipid-binding SYLF domain-containing protein
VIAIRQDEIKEKRIMSLKSRIGCLVAVLTMTAILQAASPEAARDRLESAAVVLDQLTNSSIHPEQIAKADCVAVIPGFKKGAAGVGVGFGRGFISCRNGDNWSAPGAVSLESASFGVQIGGEKVNIVILSTDKELRSKLLSDSFRVGSDASAAWVDGKSAHDGTNAKLLFFSQTKGTFAGFDLDGVTLKADDSTNKALYGKAITTSQVVDGDTDVPEVAKPLLAKLSQEASR